jgi:thiol-disulfide isomerase/thioredoxin
MIRTHATALSMLLLLAAGPVPAAVPGGGRALVDSVAGRYASLSSFRFEGVVHGIATGGRLPKPALMEVPFAYSAVRPSRLRNESMNPYMPTVTVADGESVWVSAPSLHQFTVAAAPALAPGAPFDALTRTFDPMRTMAAVLGEGLESVREIGRDTLHTSAGPVSCRKLELNYAPDSTRQNMRMLPRVLWIDDARRLLLRDSLSVELNHPQFGNVLQIQDVRVVRADLADGGPDSLYRFAPPPGSKRVAQLGPEAPPEPDHAGEPAHDFSLALLGGNGRKVSLAAQRGQVVVLDFWATWCGPCRRWMPIVAKLERELAGKGVKFYAVNLREPAATVRAYVKQQKVAVPVLMDADGAVGAAYGAESIPLTVIVGRDGKIVKTLLGLHPEADLRGALRAAGVAGL